MAGYRSSSIWRLIIPPAEIIPRLHDRGDMAAVPRTFDEIAPGRGVDLRPVVPPRTCRAPQNPRSFVSGGIQPDPPNEGWSHPHAIEPCPPRRVKTGPPAVRQSPLPFKPRLRLPSRAKHARQLRELRRPDTKPIVRRPTGAPPRLQSLAGAAPPKPVSFSLAHLSPPTTFAGRNCHLKNQHHNSRPRRLAHWRAAPFLSGIQEERTADWP